MKAITIILSLLIPITCFSQEDAPSMFGDMHIPLNLDTDTTYYYKLNNLKCYEALWGQSDKLVVYERSVIEVKHSFSLNCCTDHYYKINVKGDSVNLSYSEDGEFCTCGSCNYEVYFYSSNSVGKQYIISTPSNDTIVSTVQTDAVTSSVDPYTVNYNSQLKQIVLDNLNKQSKYSRIFIRDLQGKEWFYTETNEASLNIDSDNYKPGLYFVTIETGQKAHTQKIVIPRK